MNIQRLPEQITRLVTIICGLGFALILVKSAGDGQLGRVGLALALLIAAYGTLAARDGLWIAVAVGWGLTGRIPALEIPFGARDLLILWVFAAYLMFAAFKIVRRRPSLTLADFLLYAMVLYLVIGFIRNPVGVAAFSSDRVGGRPYFNVFIASLAYLILSRGSLSPGASNRTALAVTGARLFDGVTAQLLHWLPPLIPIFAIAYVSDYHDAIDSGVRFNPTSAFYAESTERLGYLAAIGMPVLFYCAARFPLRAIFHPAKPWRLLLVLGGLMCVLLSGFRSTLVLCALFFVVAGYFHRGRSEVFRMTAIGLVILFIVIAGNNTMFTLPRSAQRALSWLPGKWDAVAVSDAKGSTEWRTQMWEIMLTTNRYIDNHWLGDGFGFKKRDLDQIAWNVTYGNGAGSQEDFMITGGVHSGPVSAIRYVGYVGLALYLGFLVVLARDAWRCCRRAKGTPYQTLTMIVAIPVIIEPVFYVVIYGAFDSGLPNTIFALGMLKMLQNSFRDYLNSPTSPVPVTQGSQAEALQSPMVR